MKRFFFEEEDDDNEDEMMNEAERMLPEFVPEFFAMQQQENPAVHVLNYAVRICENNYLWRFLGNAKKVEMIESVFGDLMALIEAPPGPEGKEEE